LVAVLVLVLVQGSVLVKEKVLVLVSEQVLVLGSAATVSALASEQE
jgi:hypothetical protein